MPTPPSTDALAFEAALRANPDDLAGWCAYADYLTEQGDPRGEFMQVQIALEDESRPKAERSKLKKREAALLKKHEREWLGELAENALDAPLQGAYVGEVQTSPRRAECRFSRGWLSRIEFVHSLNVETARRIVRTPEARLLRELLIYTAARDVPVGTEDDYDSGFYEPGPDVPRNVDPCHGPALHALCHFPYLDGIRVFRFGPGSTDTNGRQEAESSGCEGDIVHLLVERKPNLEELYLFADDVKTDRVLKLPLPNLRVFHHDHNDNYPLALVAKNPTLSNLTAILCHPHCIKIMHSGGAYIGLPELRGLCRAKHLTKLTHLRLRLTDFGDKGAAEIVKSGFLKHLKMLDLQGGCMSDKGARLLAASPDLKNLEYLNLARNAIEQAGHDALAATGVRFDLSNQHNDTEPYWNSDYLSEGDME